MPAPSWGGPSCACATLSIASASARLPQKVPGCGANSAGRRTYSWHESYLRGLGFSSLRGGNRELQAFRFAHYRDRRHSADALAVEQTVEIVDAVHRLRIERHDDVARLQSGAAGRAPAFHRREQHPAGLNQAMRAHGESRERHVLPAYADAGTPYVSVRNELPRDEFHRVHRDREADALGRQDDGGVDADHVAARVEQWAARVPRIQRGVGLDHVVDQAPGDGSERAAQGADDAGRHGALEAERIPD